jgi:monofunctional biosynthetic peptidoglycan transglycosylase
MAAGGQNGQPGGDRLSAPTDADPKTAAEAVRRLDRHLNGVKSRKKGGWIGRLLVLALLLGLVLPVSWALIYRVFEAPGTILMVQRAMAGETISRRAVPLEDISPHLVRAVIAAEDSRFCTHDGFDIEAIEAAIAFNERAEKRGSKRRRGASTISQQTAKNLFLWPQRSWVRKGAETYFTGIIETAWPKRRIMEAYLNAAEWGEGRFGAEAAARGIFGKSAKDLSPQEAARLAAVLPSPNKWSAETPGPYVRRRAATILERMRQVRADRLDACVLEPGAAPPPPPKRRIEEEAPLPPPPVEGPEAAPDVVAEGASPGEAPAPEAGPADAPGADVQDVQPTDVSPTAPPAAEPPLDLRGLEPAPEPAPAP